MIPGEKKQRGLASLLGARTLLGASLLGARTLLGAPGIGRRNTAKKVSSQRHTPGASGRRLVLLGSQSLWDAGPRRPVERACQALKEGTES